jgi:predicted permease
MQRLSVVDDGLKTEQVLTMEVPKDFNGASPAATIAFYERIQSQLAAIPGVSEVGIGSNMPLRTSGITLDINADGHPVAPGQAQPHSEYRLASPEYFHAAGIPLLKGRFFTSTDRAESPRVVILNKTLADQFFPNQDPIGQRVAWTGEVLKFIGVSGDWRTVVGVVGDTKDGGLDATPIPATFIPFAQGDFPSGGFVIRTTLNPSSLAAAATRVVREAAPDQPIEQVLTVDQIRDESVAPRRLNAMLVSSFGILAMIVAAVGIAAVLAFSVTARTNEIGVRMSLGADSGRVQRMVLSEGGRLVIIGLAFGVLGALSLTRLIQGLLFGVPPHDPVTLTIVATIMAVVGIGACWIPAIRASRIEPAVALRAG